MLKKISAKTFSTLLLAWFDQHGRKELPWQHHKTPYRVWVSEIMLQQTQVSTVIHYFQRFIERFPTVQALSKASEDEVLHYWTGLGYYSRARNLHRSAKLIANHLNSVFPSTLEELIALPGIGRSTAGAILAIGFNQPATILDGNVKRVLTRFHGMTEWPGEKKIHDQLWAFAETYTPVTRVADYTQAIMDLGATLCIRGKPACTRCPVQKYCIAHSLGIEKTLPRPKPKKTLPIRHTTWMIFLHHNHILIEKRPSVGIWGGLWSFPEITGTLDKIIIKKTCRQQFRFQIQTFEFAPTFRHTFSHFHLEISPVFIHISPPPSKIMDSEQQIWYNLNSSQTIGMPAPVKALLASLQK